MITQVFATKIGMGQAWSKSGKRLSVCRLKMEDAVIVGKKTQEKDQYQALQVAFGQKKLANMTKPLRTIVTKSGFSLGRRYIREIHTTTDTFDQYEVGKVTPFTEVVKVGDIVDVQGTTKGKGFTGGMKRHGFHGGPKTHGQSDRARAPGSIGSGTTPGRVYKGKKMAGHHGMLTKTIKNLQVIHIDEDQKEVWVSGSVPGHINAVVRLTVREHQEFEGLKVEVRGRLSEVSKEAKKDVEENEQVTENSKEEIEVKKSAEPVVEKEAKTEAKVEDKEEQPKEEKKAETQPKKEEKKGE